MSYLTKFRPERTRLGSNGAGGPDVKDGSVYVYTEPTVLAVRVAQATSRPLLLYGRPGSGKSSLASFVARTMNWNYFEQVVTSRTQAQDLQWSFDAVRRLRDAKAPGAPVRMEDYIEPRVLWWGFDCAGAERMRSAAYPDATPEAWRPPGVIRGYDHPSVVLIDEIDKADPDVPNDLLVVIGTQRFQVSETGQVVPPEPRPAPLIMITTNDERELPRAFLRRCVVHTLGDPSEEKLVQIAQNHFPEQDAGDDLFARLAARVVGMRDSEGTPGSRSPSTAEYLDAIRACIEFGVRPGDSPEWKSIESAVLVKGRT